MSYLYLPGVAGEYASLPDIAAYTPSNDLDIRILVELDDWTATQTLVGKAKNTTTREWRLDLAATGRLNGVFNHTDGTSGNSVSTNSDVLSVSDGDKLAVRCTMDFDNGAAGNTVSFFTKAATSHVELQDGTGWTAVGSTVNATARTLFGSDSVVEIGALFVGTIQAATGNVFGVVVLGDGAVIIDADFSNLTQAEVEAGSFTEDANAAVVTLNGDEWAYVEPHTSGVLGRAELLLRADNKYAKGSPKWPDLSGNNHHAQHGSAAGADTNDPLFLPWTGEQSLYLPALTGNDASTPNAAPLDIVGDIDIRVDVAPDDWTPATRQALMGKSDAYVFLLDTPGTLVLWHYTATVFRADTSTANLSGLANGTRRIVRVTRTSADGKVNFYTSSDNGTTWDQLGAEVSGVSGAIDSNANVVRVGSRGAEYFGGHVYQAWLYPNLTETSLAFNPDFTDAAALKEPFATFVEKSSNAATVTINRAASGRVSTVVDRPMFLLGTDDYFEIPDHANLNFAAGDDFTAMVVFRGQVPSGQDFLMTKKTDLAATNAGWMLYQSNNQVTCLIADGTARVFPVKSSWLANTTVVAAAVRNTTDDDLAVFLDGATGTPLTDPTTATLANALTVRIGDSGGGGSNLHAEIHAAALFREALSDADLAAAGVELTQLLENQLLLVGVG